MSRKSTQAPPSTAKDAREERLKSALKANLQRRKAQARARARDQAETEKTSTRSADGKNKAG